jgi:hypothetical protein
VHEIGPSLAEQVGEVQVGLANSELGTERIQLTLIDVHDRDERGVPRPARRGDGRERPGVRPGDVPGARDRYPQRCHAVNSNLGD